MFTSIIIFFILFKTISSSLAKDYLYLEVKTSTND